MLVWIFGIEDVVAQNLSDRERRLTGDGVVVPAVRFLADALIEPRGLAHKTPAAATLAGLAAVLATYLTRK